MNQEKKQILEMLAQNKITVLEAEQLLNALEQPTTINNGHSATNAGQKKWKYLRVSVQPAPNAPPEHAQVVNVRIPIQLLRAGIKLTSLIPLQAQQQINSALQEKGINIDLTQIKASDLEELLESLSEFTVDVRQPYETVQVYCE